MRVIVVERRLRSNADRLDKIRGRYSAPWQDIKLTRMNTHRREFLRTAAVTAGSAATWLPSTVYADDPEDKVVDGNALEREAAKPVLDRSLFAEPVIIESIELLRKGKKYFSRVRSKDGAEGISVDNGRANLLHPILNRLVAPYFVGKDARDLDELLFGVYREGDNYKLQGLALWCPVAMVEFAILDMLGRIAKRPIGDLL